MLTDKDCYEIWSAYPDIVMAIKEGYKLGYVDAQTESLDDETDDGEQENE
jgi:hypothetical protein